IAQNRIGYTNTGAPQAIQVQAYTKNSYVHADGDLKLSATAKMDIESVVVAASVVASTGTIAGIGLGGAGASATNTIGTTVQAYIDGADPNSDGTGNMGIVANSISLNADDTSSITAFTGSASLAVAIGSIGASVSIGVGLAENQISNQVLAYIANSTHVEAT